MDLTNRQQLIQYLQSHRLYTKKSLGQNFLVDRNALDKIVAAAELSKDDCAIEVGPGLGVMTEELVKQAGKVVAVEIDEKLTRLLAERLQNQNSKIKSQNDNLKLNKPDLDFCDIPISSFVIPTPDQVEGKTPAGILYSDGSPGHARRIGRLPEDDREKKTYDKTIQQFNNLTIVNNDILRINITELTKDCPSYKVVANIPYYITSRILRFFLEAERKPETIVLLTQKEVAERICAKPGDMSVLSVSVQYYGTPEIIDIVPKTSFFPAPEVDSAILRIAKIKNQNSKLKIKEADLFRCVHIGFASRRKTLLNNLSAGYHLDKKSALDILEKVGLNERTRAQELSIENWTELCVVIVKLLNC